MADDQLALRGRGLRFVLVEELRQHGTMTVAEMVRVIDAFGFTLDGRASKIISDSLRWELARGRVERIARGVYRYRRVPRSTARRIRIFARFACEWITANSQGATPPPTPSTPLHRKPLAAFFPEDPTRPPWYNLAWLWST